MTTTTYTTIPVSTASQTYDVRVGTNLLGETGPMVQEACPRTDAAFVVTDSNVAPLYLMDVESSLRSVGLRVASITVSAGEQNKNLGTFGTILEAMAQAELTRDSVVVALGGGVVGDMAGFAAASYMRGIRVVQVPTTLLSMVDSSVGGKTAIDLRFGKNLVGAFLQPSLVVADVECLRTLEPDVFVDGIGEIVKHGVLADRNLFESLAQTPLTQSSDAAYLVQVVAQNVRIKRDVVNTDEREHGLRQTLNLGHTIGHAIEAASGYSLGHGHCVAAGLCCVARAAARLGWAESSEMARTIEECISAQGLPTGTNIAEEELVRQATHDKKRHGDSVNLIVPITIGSVCIRNVTIDELATVIHQGVI